MKKYYKTFYENQIHYYLIATYLKQNWCVTGYFIFYVYSLSSENNWVPVCPPNTMDTENIDTKKMLGKHLCKELSFTPKIQELNQEEITNLESLLEL
jgi:hypothetical protein